MSHSNTLRGAPEHAAPGRGMSRAARRRWRTALIAGGIVAAVLVCLAALAWYLAPYVMPNLTTSVAEADTTEELRAPGASAQVTVPEGWAFHRAWGDDAELVLRSPDARLTVTLAVRASPLSEAFDAVADRSEATAAAAPARERLASGLEVVHAEAPAEGLLVGAVAPGEGGPSVAVSVSGPADGVKPYRAALAGVLETVRVS
jgi:hypothetical protein